MVHNSSKANKSLWHTFSLLLDVVNDGCINTFFDYSTVFKDVALDKYLQVGRLAAQQLQCILLIACHGLGAEAFSPFQNHSELFVSRKNKEIGNIAEPQIRKIMIENKLVIDQKFNSTIYHIQFPQHKQIIMSPAQYFLRNSPE